MKEKITAKVLTDLPNIGDILAEKLTSVGITCYDDLASIGSVEAVLKIRDGADPGTCHNMLYALEGAIRGVRWHNIPREDRGHLKREFNHASRYATLGKYHD